jgi:hypothetical protein
MEALSEGNALFAPHRQIEKTRTYALIGCQQFQTETLANRSENISIELQTH